MIPGGEHKADRPYQGLSGSATVRRGGLQVSVGRMLEVLQGAPWVLPEVQARRAVAKALPERQRERFLA